ncbi:hypothetical protein BC938DRAFT_475972 [Jimgerdemannia flammicorona]|uniref:Uncharacterized protein n=1 Tax=Jimgerdemannia flammicorona TaxID=994334 RepID=A0A433QR36_9FUNG|nr:hypothetical protein BC938DRAFT_475972 [Jimgerdemannia flammicorona]
MPMERMCCCLPLRAATIFLSLAAVLGNGAALAMLVWKKPGKGSLLSHIQLLVPYHVSCSHQSITLHVDILNAFPDDLKLYSTILYYASLGISGTYVLIGLLGFIGAARRVRILVQIFNWINWLLVLLIVSGMLAIWVYVLTHKQQFVDDCSAWAVRFAAANTTNPSFDRASLPLSLFPDTDGGRCADDLQKFITWWGVGTFVGGFLWIYFSSAIGAYAGELRRQARDRKGSRTINSFKPMSQRDLYQPLTPPAVVPRPSQEGLTAAAAAAAAAEEEEIANEEEELAAMKEQELAVREAAHAHGGAAHMHGEAVATHGEPESAADAERRVSNAV